MAEDIRRVHMKTLTKNVKGSIGIVIIGLIYLYEALKLPLGSLRAPDSGLLPLIFVSALIGFCLLQIVIDFLPKKQGHEKKVDEETTDPKKPIIIIVALCVFCLVLNKLGFILSAIPLTFVALRVMQYKSRGVSLVVSVIVTLIIYLVFSELLGVYLPPGILG
ncbi:tripartite tricarboxylate transporter TctB family protein [Desulfitobacterium sp. THU1]|uniref:tripartite tricarboxylate transporter TctB family protein n=1 Tax=Desulfitobacterium sp. THU1 TaxID=3138072 RepID=UPI00311FE933